MLEAKNVPLGRLGNGWRVTVDVRYGPDEMGNGVELIRGEIGVWSSQPGYRSEPADLDRLVMHQHVDDVDRLPRPAVDPDWSAIPGEHIRRSTDCDIEPSCRFVRPPPDELTRPGVKIGRAHV